MDPSGIKEGNVNERKTGRREGKDLFLQDLLFLPGKAVATDLQQIERPLASEMSATTQETGEGRESQLPWTT
jgi:hypothetical protein